VFFSNRKPPGNGVRELKLTTW